MRSLGLALLAVAFTVPTATAAVIEIRENPCGCDPSAGDVDTRTVIVRAEPGEANLLYVEFNSATVTTGWRSTGSAPSVDAGPGADSVHSRGGVHLMMGGPGRTSSCRARDDPDADERSGLPAAARTTFWVTSQG